MRCVIRLFFRLLRRLLMPFMLIYAAVSKPKPITRDQQAQTQVDTECRNLTLYQFATCPFCIKVKKEIHRLALPIGMANVQKDAQARAELEHGGGRVKVPCLKIEHQDGRVEWMYESSDINDYLRQRFAP
ncbi:glutaredoxin family protein [Marinobacterium mangrovicola]|uniref:Glutaredoxin n=1 Tax=Marinobacterium mangrovicola TaxID=1476959 RepID=A0A4R1GBJ3_9GAMM|nr:glutaredoxin domain-containing protein [Marinobacterium mangrovicola]TCK04143.1 glutaredoxin [Marinobacterium mangrovicola]